ncbi:serine/threonine-protein kinase [Variovorax sp. J22R24]|uniref:serine/threonine protein kinase n=1 Tax=Variovorax gracilis TaxID=3053502 RepID=UPI0025788711|nr:serine/threonine-protein kinase [Variovorax sp. J22R24]MDM0108854.1 serine/threonine-protein kinase [Variovorax sp. J22R24]
MQCVTALPSADASLIEPFDEGKTMPYVKTELTPRSRDADARASRLDSIHALPTGTEIEGFRILRQIGEGGFGIVYLAWDLALERHVAIKEYMPSSLAVRGVSMEVSMRSEQQRETFDAGLKSFVNEARLLARFDHPALVKVFRYWEANGTAYMAMPYYQGPTLKTALSQLGTRAPEALLREWLDPLLDALAVMHAEQCYHRDISPDNILLTASGPLLLDFGAARHVINDRTQVLTTMLKPGFAPVEQYGGTMLQGAWTDLYALAGVVHYAITGRPPIASVVRVVNDPLPPLAVSHAGYCSEGFLRAIDAALAVRPEARPQDVAAFRALLDGEARPRTEAPEPPQAEAMPATAAAEATLGAPVVSRAGRNRYAVLVAVMLSVAAVIGASWQAWTPSEGARATAAPSAAAVPTDAGPATAAHIAMPAAEKPAPVPAPAPVAAPAATTARAAVAQERPTLAAVQPPAAVSPARVAGPRRATAPPPAAAPAELVTRASEKNRTLSHEAETTSSYNQTARPPRCSDLVLKSSLEPLNPEEAAFQKSRCK